MVDGGCGLSTALFLHEEKCDIREVDEAHGPSAASLLHMCTAPLPRRMCPGAKSNKTNVAANNHKDLCLNQHVIDTLTNDDCGEALEINASAVEMKLCWDLYCDLHSNHYLDHH